MESGQLSAAVAREMGVLSGQRFESREIGAAGEFGALAGDELERAARSYSALCVRSTARRNTEIEVAFPTARKMSGSGFTSLRSVLERSRAERRSQ
jgi:hypothetical protein